MTEDPAVFDDWKPFDIGDEVYSRTFEVFATIIGFEGNTSFDLIILMDDAGNILYDYDENLQWA